MLSVRDLAVYQETGILHVPRLFAPDRIGAAREAVVRALAELGLWRGGALDLPPSERLAFPAKAPGLKKLGKRYPELEALLDEPALDGAIDALMAGHPQGKPFSSRPQLLVTFPNADKGPVPLGWHVDVPHLPSGETPGVQLFALIDDVAPGGGGTMVMPGTHRLARPGPFLQNKGILQRMREHDELRAMLGCKCPVPPRDRAALLDRHVEVEDIEIGIAELSGRAADAWFVALGVLHSGTPNGTGRARMMATHRFLRADAVAAIAEGFGWREELV